MAELRLRQAVFDRELGVEACRLTGVRADFPRHFHEYYVLGLVETGRRRLYCRERCQEVCPGMVLLFNPGDVHGCEQSAGAALAYRALHIRAEVMERLCRELGGGLPPFSTNALQDGALAEMFRGLHLLIMEQGSLMAREEALLLLLSRLLGRCGGVDTSRSDSHCFDQVAAACAYMQEHFAEPVNLSQLCAQVNLSKSTLLRAFAANMGVTPHGYLVNIRISRAKVLLQQGLPVAEAALQAGFADQSHLTNSFRRFIGLTPGAYRDIFVKRRRGAKAD